MYKLKFKPEDFLVKEIFSRELKEKGDYSIFELEKRERNTMDVVNEISRRTNKKVGFAGTKDRNAITIQHISVYGSPKFLENLNVDKVKLEFLGYSDDPISLGSHEGNSFEIVVRNLEKFDLDLKKEVEFVNYFGEQRFGKNNLEIAKAILKKDYKLACKLFDDNKINEALEESPGDYTNALRKLPRKLINLIVNSYQSYLWNLCASKFEDSSIPLPGFGIDFENEEIEEFYDSAMEKDGLNMRSFIIREIPNLNTEGVMRDRITLAKDVKVGDLEDDEEFNSKKKVKISFSLGKGSYATVFIASLFER